MLEGLSNFFSGFSNIWASAEWGPVEWIFWPLNALACAIIAFEAFAMLHLSQSRWHRLAYGLVSFGAFTYAVGELGGKYLVVAPVETVFHWSIVFGLGASLVRRARENSISGEQVYASGSQRAEMGQGPLETPSRYSSGQASRGEKARS